MAVRRGQVYWLDFGSPTGSVQAGRRPALVIQNDVGNSSSSTTIVAAMTTQLRKPYPFHVPVSAGESGLPAGSLVLLEQLQTIPQDRLVKMCGSLSPTKMTEVDAAIRVSLGLR